MIYQRKVIKEQNNIAKKKIMMFISNYYIEWLLIYIIIPTLNIKLSEVQSDELTHDLRHHFTYCIINIINY